MPDLYVPLDANYPDDDRFLALTSPFAELLAIRSFALCKRLRSDGFVHERQAWKLAGDFVQYVDVVTVFRDLEDSGLWVSADGGWLVPSWSKHNKTRADIEAERDEETARKRDWRSRQAATERPTGQTGATPSNTKESKAKNSTAPESSPADRREDVDRLCDLLVTLIEGNGCRRPTIVRSWRSEARLLLDKDGIPPDEAERVMRWALADEFWRSNILSMPTFRKQFDRLRLASHRNGSKPHAPQADAFGNELML